MAKTKTDNKLKRKRGKKFVYRDPNEESKSTGDQAANPFEDHSKSKRARKDAEIRQGMVQEYRQIGRNSQIIDNRIAEKSSKLSEEDKMKLRYMREQKEQLQKEVGVTRMNKKRNKFLLDGDESDEETGFNFLTHGGKKIEDLDDFKDKIQNSDDEDLYEHRDEKKGIITEEMVNALNFGGGPNNEQEGHKKTREERHAEIMEKSKAFKYHAQQVKEANQEYTKQLDDDWNDVAALLTFKQRDADQVIPDDARKDEGFDNLLTRLKTEGGIEKVQP